jgi:hypothetical protein
LDNIRHGFLNGGEFIEESGKEDWQVELMYVVGLYYGVAISCSCFSAVCVNTDGVWSVCPYLTVELAIRGFVCEFSGILQ